MRLRRVALVFGLGSLALLLVAGLALALWLGLRDAHWLEATPYGALEVADGLVDAPIGLGQGFEAVIASTPDGPQLRVTHGAQVLWASVPGRAFVAAARGQAALHEARGMAFVEDDIDGRCVDARVERMVALTPDNPALIEGTLDCGGTPWPFSMVLAARGDRRVTFDIALAGGDHRAPNRVLLVKQSAPDEGFFGFGEQFSHFDLKGRDVPIVVSEQGIGRGVQPLTLGADLTADGAGGSWATTYVAVPWYVTSTLQGFALEEDVISRFDLRRPEAAVVSLLAPRMRGSIYRGDSPLSLIEAYTATVGRMAPLPDWVHNGAVIGMQGGTARVRAIRAKLAEAQVPVAAFWLQDWVGQRRTSFGKQLWWSWTLDRDHYPDWEGLVSDLDAEGIRVMTYVNPFLVDASERGPGRDLFGEARDAGYLVQRADGSPYLIVNTSFSAGLLDLTNPAARAWFLDVMRDEVIGRGAMGWMADFGEGLPFDAKLWDPKVDPAAYHNAYPAAWAEINREAVRRAGLEGEAVFFTRAGYRTSPAHSTLFWLGDQLVSWDADDGIKSAVLGLLSGGVSGFSLNHADIGGYTTITHVIRDYHRSAELHRRWAELAAFTVVYRTHEGNRPDANAQFHDEGVLDHFAAMARLHQCWMPYREGLIDEASRLGWPVARHMWLHYPDDPAMRRVRFEQFLVGADLLVAPALDPGVASVEVTLPDDGWVHLWSGDRFDAGRHTVPAPIGQPAVFTRAGSMVDGLLAVCPQVEAARKLR